MQYYFMEINECGKYIINSWMVWVICRKIDFKKVIYENMRKV